MAPPDGGGTAPALCHDLRDGEESSRTEVVVSIPSLIFKPQVFMSLSPVWINYLSINIY